MFQLGRSQLANRRAPVLEHDSDEGKGLAVRASGQEEPDGLVEPDEA